MTADGVLSDAALHEELTEGVDDTDLRRSTMNRLIEGGLNPEDARRLFPELV